MKITSNSNNKMNPSNLKLLLSMSNKDGKFRTDKHSCKNHFAND